MADLHGMVGGGEMKYFTLFRGVIRKQKGSYIGIILLMFIFTLTISSVLSVWLNSRTYVNEEMDRVHFGDMQYVFTDTEEIDTLLQDIRNVDGVERVTMEKMVYGTIEIGEDEQASHRMLKAVPKDYSYHIFKGETAEYDPDPETLSAQESYVPISFRSIYDSKIGDSFQIKAADGEELSYTIKGFFEDPAEGSAMMGVKNLLLSEEGLERLRTNVYGMGDAIPEGAAVRAYIVNVTKSRDCQLTAKKLQMKIGEETDVDRYVLEVYLKDSFASFMLMLQNIFAAFLVGFGIVLIMVTMLVISHSITSSIEQDYVNFGILKALGYTGKDLRIVQLLYYLTALLAGLLGGVAVAGSLTRLINETIITVTGIKTPDQIPAVETTLLFGGILLLIFLFILGKTHRISLIRPITAIRGKEDVFFTDHFLPAIHGRGVQFWIAVRQIFSGKKQYVSACIITVLLVFFLSLCGRLGSWMGEDGSGIMKAMGMATVDGRIYSFGVCSEKDEVMQEADERIREQADVYATYQSLVVMTARLNDAGYLLNVISDSEYFRIVEGRTCKYDNEIVVTDIVAKELELHIGDMVEVSQGDKKEDYMIVGINQCANDMGENFGISREGYDRISDGTDSFYTCYILEDGSRAEAIEDDLEEHFGDQIHIDDNTWSGIDGIVSAASALELLMYLISLIFSMVAVYMTGSRMLYQEKHDLSIYKAVGFSSSRLRLSFAIRFAIVAGVGAVLGVVMSALLTDLLVGKVFAMFGVNGFASNPELFKMMIPGVIVAAVFFGCAYLVSARIKKADAGVLIAE